MAVVDFAAKAARHNARANEVTTTEKTHAEEALGREMVSLDDSAIALFAKGCAEPFAVLPNKNDPRVASPSHRLRPRNTAHWSGNCAEEVATPFPAALAKGGAHQH